MMDAEERARLRKLANKWARLPAYAFVGIEFELAAAVAPLLDALDAAEARIAALTEEL